MIRMHAASSARRCAALTGGLIALSGAVSLSPAQDAAEASPPTPRPPNIIFILADDLGWADLGFSGSAYHESPHLDALAADGVVFTNAYANAPNCAPSRACLLTGQYTPRHGIYTVNSPARGKAGYRRIVPTPNETTLDLRFITIAEVLASEGYVSAAMGKWHMGDHATHGPTAQGFDINIAGSHKGHPPAGYFSPYKLPNVEEAPKGEYLTDRLNTEAVRFIEAHADEPFFLYLSHYAVHTPIQAPVDTVDRWREREGVEGQANPTYAAMIEHMDQGVGEIRAALDRLDIDEHTAIFFFSDNGGVAGRGITSNAPLRGGKGMLYEGGIREPCIVYWPGHTPSGAVCDTPIIGIDFYPTMAAIAGADLPEDQPCDGVNILPLLQGETMPSDRPLYWHFPAYLEGKAPGSRDPRFRTRPGGAIRVGDFKLIEYFEDGAIELYDLHEDPGETTNLAEIDPDRADALLEQLRAWRDAVGAPVPTEPNPKYQPDAE
jgi:arylsulfatase A-like enzyme